MGATKAVGGGSGGGATAKTSTLALIAAGAGALLLILRRGKAAREGTAEKKVAKGTAPQSKAKPAKAKKKAKKKAATEVEAAAPRRQLSQPMSAAKVAGGRRVAKQKKKAKKKIPAATATTASKLKDKVKKRTGGVDPNQSKAQLLPAARGQKGLSAKDDTGDKGGEGEEIYSMGYTYTTTVTDARVQAISGKHKALLAKKIPTKDPKKDSKV